MYEIKYEYRKAVETKKKICPQVILYVYQSPFGMHLEGLGQNSVVSSISKDKKYLP